jgi:hemerythrin-like domain-containing protein
MAIFPAPDFDHPLEMLAACHERIGDQCGTLRLLAVHLRDRGNDEQAREAAGAVVRYFDTAGLLHHRDEEDDLLPRMRSAAHGTDALRLARIVSRLLAEHVSLDGAWRAIRPALEGVLKKEAIVLAESCASRFAARYDAHIAFEEREMLPLARVLLSPGDLATIGQSMAARRTVS